MQPTKHNNTVDANLWARLKLKYELYCYKQVEILIHRRLRQLAAVERLPTVDGTSNNSRARNLSTLKLLATIIDASAASSGVVAGEEDAASWPEHRRTHGDYQHRRDNSL